MKLFSKSEMQALETAATKHGITLAQMMENAGTALAEAAQERFGPLAGKPVVLLCGKGNNGGDGFVCARKLAEAGAACTVVLAQGQPKTGLAAAAFAQMPQPVTVTESGDVLDNAYLVVDCLYGFGFRGELDPASAALTARTNALGCWRLSADLPSGVECDTGRAAKDAFQAHATVAFTAEKPGLRSYPAREYCGEVLIRQVGVPSDLLAEATTQCVLTEEADVRAVLPVPDVQANKGDLGRLLLVCGSYGMAGACVIAARAALRMGTGLVHIAAERSIYPILAGAVPEAVFTMYDSGSPAAVEEALGAALKACTACVIGPGLGSLSDLLCPIVFAYCEKPLLIDADGLNFAARTGFDLRSVSIPLVITPHPGEAARLLGRTVPAIQAERIPAARALAESTGAAALLKGAATVINCGERLAINPTGNPGMAQGGSGDVLAGIIGALLAQGVEAFSAAQAGAWLHGRAGDICRERLSARAMLPTDLPECLPEIFKNFERD